MHFTVGFSQNAFHIMVISRFSEHVNYEKKGKHHRWKKKNPGYDVSGFLIIFLNQILKKKN